MSDDKIELWMIGPATKFCECVFKATKAEAIKKARDAGGFDLFRLESVDYDFLAASTGESE